MQRNTTNAFPDTLDLVPRSRRPVALKEETVRTVLDRPIPPRRASDDGALTGEPPAGFASIVVVTFDNLVFTRICIESVLANTAETPYELILVDNGSTDGTIEYLQRLTVEYPQVRLIRNPLNQGFGPATNQGLAAARGDLLILLNNDTLVPGNWLARLTRHLDDPSIGLVSPTTNRSGNESEIDAPYRTYGDLVRFAEDRYRVHEGECTDISSLVMFCAAMRRELWQEIGLLDERFEIGMFEDDDYAMRVRAAGYRLACAEDAFVHHFGQASIGKLAASGRFGELFHANRQRWEDKWGLEWSNHRRRPAPEYRALVERLRDVARTAIAPAATIAVISRGDDELLDLDVRNAWHFPSGSDGDYAGYHPRDADEAIAHLEALRARGVEYLLIPSTEFWWLDDYPGFRQHLESRYQLLTHDPRTCAVFALASQPVLHATTATEERPDA